MKDILALVTRLVVALEIMAQSMSGGKSTPALTQVDAEPEGTPAEEEEAPKPKKAGKAKVKEEAPKVDYAALRETGTARIKELAGAGLDVAAMKKLVAKHGAPKFSEMADEKLEGFLADLEALAALESDV